MAKDDFDIDSDLDWPDLDFGDPQEPSNDREPALKSGAKQVAKGTMKAAFNEQQIRKTAKKILPGRHSDVADLAFEAKSLIKEAYSQTSNEAQKTKRELQRSMRNFNRQTKGMFPKGISDLLEKLGGEAEGYYGQQSKEEKDRAHIDSVLLEVFGEQEKEKIQDKEKAAAKELRAEVLNRKRFSTQMEVFTGIHSQIKRVADFTSLDGRVKRKQIELQIQSNLLLGEMLESVGQMRKETLEELKLITKNTGLPEATKINLSEEFKRVNAQRLLEKVGNPIYGGLGDYLSRTSNNINKRFMNATGDLLRSLRNNAAGAMDMAGEMMAAQRDVREMGGEDDTIETITELLGGMFFDKVGDKYGGKAKNYLAKTKWLGGRMGMADNLITQGHAMLNRQASLREDEVGIGAKARNFLRTLLDRTTLNPAVAGFNAAQDAGVDDPVMKRKAIHSVVTIIPGLIARVHHELVKIRTGNEDIPMIRFDSETGVFSDTKTMIGRARKLLVGDDAQYTNEGMDKVLNSALNTEKMTGTQRELFKDHMNSLIMRQLPFDPRLIAMGEMSILGKGSREDKEVLRNMFKEQYQVGKGGEVAGDLDKYLQRTADVAKQMKTMQYKLKDPRREILELIEQGYTEELLAMGVLVDKGGRLEIDFDQVTKMRFDDNVGLGASLLKGDYNPSGMRKMGGNNITRNIQRTINKVVNTSNFTSQVTNTANVNARSFSRVGSEDGWGKENTYNSEYQSLVLEEIIDVLKQGQELNSKHFERIAEAVDKLSGGDKRIAEAVDKLSGGDERIIEAIGKLNGSDERYNAEYQTAVLEEIMDILQDGRQYTNTNCGDGSEPKVGFIGRQKDRLKRGFARLREMGPRGLVSAAKDFLNKGRAGDLLRRAYSNVEKVKDRIFDGVSWGVQKFHDIRDWYRSGELKPVLEARLLAARQYFDSATGKVVERLKDVKGDIVKYGSDGLKQIVLTYEELVQGIRDGSGKEFVAKKATSVVNWIGQKLGAPIRILRDARDNIRDLVNNPIGKAKSFLFGIPDVYVKGETKPRLLAIKAKNGEYINIDGTQVRTLKDIKGEVRNSNFELILSEEDIALGLVDENGNDLSMFAPGLRGLMQRLMSVPGRLLNKIPGVKGLKKLFRGGIKATAKRIKNRVVGFGKSLAGLFTGIGGGIMGKLRGMWRNLKGDDESPEEELVNIGYAQLEVQGAILDQLVGMNKRKRKHKWDQDGSGNIDGSWRDLLLSRKKKKEEKEKGKDGDKEEKEGGLIGFLKNAFGVVAGAIGGLLGGLISGLGGAIWGAAKWLAMALMGKTGLDSIMPGGRDRGRNRRRNNRVKPGARGKWAAALTAIGLGGWFGADYLMDEGDPSEATQMDTNTRSTSTRSNNNTRTNNSTKPSSSSKIDLKNYTRTNPAGGSAWTSIAKTGLKYGLRGGLAASGLLLNPVGAVVAGAAAAAMVGYSIQDTYKNRPLRDIRLAQYGVNRTSSNQEERYLQFEAWFIENAKIGGDGKYTLNHLPQIELLAAMEDTIGGVEKDVPKAWNWLSNRFIPVVSGWIRALGKIRKVDAFHRIDEVLPVSEKRVFLESVKDLGNGKLEIALPGEDITLPVDRAKEIISKGIEEINGGFLATDKDDQSLIGRHKAGLSNAWDVMTGASDTDKGEWGSVIGYLKKTNFVTYSYDIMKGYFQGTAAQEEVSRHSDIMVKDEPLDALRSIRMKTYGLTELRPEWVNAILRLEAELVKFVSYSGKNTAVLTGRFEDALVNFSREIGIGDKDIQGMRNASFWIDQRFRPAYLAYLGGAKEAGIQDPIRAHLRDSKSKQYRAVQPMLTAQTKIDGKYVNVWATGLHPVLRQRPNGDPASISGNLEALRVDVNQTELDEISGERGGVLSGVKKKIDSLAQGIVNARNSVINTVSGWLPDSFGSKIRNWFGSDNSSALAQQQQMLAMGTRGTTALGSHGYGVIGGDGGFSQQMGAGATVNFDPSGGKYGNVNDIPLPTAPKGFEAHKDLIAAVSKMTGVDAGILAGLFATESSFDSSAKPGTSTAKGIGQFIDGTWESMVKNYGHLFGIKPGTSPNDPRANALMAVMYMKENSGAISKWKKGPITDVDLYLAHFLGADGYRKLYQNQDKIAAHVDPKAARSNPSIFYIDGDRSRPRTSAQVLALQASKQVKNRNHYGPLMHRYIVEQGGTVDSSIFASAEGVGVDTNTVGKAGAGNNPEPAETPNIPGITTVGKNTDVSKSVLDVDAGGLPTFNAAQNNVTAASAVRTAAKAGADATTAPNVPPTVMQPATPTAPPATEVVKVVTEQGGGKDSFVQESLNVGRKQLDVLMAINAGINALVEAANRGMGAQTPAGPRPVNGRTNHPVSYSSPSSS